MPYAPTEDPDVRTRSCRQLERTMKLDEITITLAALLLLSSVAIASPSTRPSAAADGWPLNGKVSDLLDAAEQAERKQDPLRFLASDMSGIVTDLDQYKTDKPVQTKQEKVVRNLDVLIEELEKQCKGGGKA